jgi:hypothetical protein
MGQDPEFGLHKTHLVLIISMYWSDGKETDRVRNLASEAMMDIEKAAEEEGVLND